MTMEDILVLVTFIGLILACIFIRQVLIGIGLLWLASFSFVAATELFFEHHYFNQMAWGKFCDFVTGLGLWVALLCFMTGMLIKQIKEIRSGKEVQKEVR